MLGFSRGLRLQGILRPTQAEYPEPVVQANAQYGFGDLSVKT